MITTIILITSQRYHGGGEVRKLKIYSLSKFPVYNTVLLATITMPCIIPRSYS